MRRALLLTAWFGLLIPTVDAAERPLSETVDIAVRAKWEEQKLTPSARSSDAEFLRRIFLDLVGTIPTHQQAAAFLDDPAPDKRHRLIDELLADPRFARHQADLWDLILFTRNPPGSESDRREGFQKWLTRQFADNVPYDQWVRALLRAEGNSVDDGPPQFFVQYRNRPEDANEAISQTFLGVQLQCARCHDHPFEAWTQLDFYGMAAFYSRLQVVGVGKDKNLTKYAIGEKSTGDILFTGPVQEQQPGKKGEPVKPKFLLGEALAEPDVPADFKEPKLEENKVPPPPLSSRKNQLADWLTARDNRFFARAIANRVWAQYMGRGLVHPVDNMSDANTPSHPELLEALSAELTAHNFDLKWYIRELVRSETYQLSSRGGAAEPLPQWFEYGRVRPLSAEELADSWKSAVWYDEFVQQQKPDENQNRFHPLQRDYIVRFFGTPMTGAGDFQGGLQEHLYLNNGPLVSLLGNQKGSLGEWLASSQEPVEMKIERLFLSTLSRRPAPEEVEQLKSFLAADGGKSPRWQDAFWALITCSEFRFNH